MQLNEEKLRTVLYRQGVTQKGLADQIGVSRNTVSAACRGGSVSFVTACKIAGALRLPLAELLRDHYQY